jgi:hypothetical protein
MLRLRFKVAMPKFLPHAAQANSRQIMMRTDAAATI